MIKLDKKEFNLKEAEKKVHLHVRIIFRTFFFIDIGELLYFAMWINCQLNAQLILKK